MTANIGLTSVEGGMNVPVFNKESRGHDSVSVILAEAEGGDYRPVTKEAREKGEPDVSTYRLGW